MRGMYQADHRRKLIFGKNKNIFEVMENIFSARSDPNTKQILDSMRSGAINIKQAAEALGMEPAMLAYQLAGRVNTFSSSALM